MTERRSAGPRPLASTSSYVRHEPVGLIEEAKERWTPIKTFCLFSGGGDSGVLAHRCRDHYDALFYIDTGTAIPTTSTTVNTRE